MPMYEYDCPRCGTRFEELIVRRADERDVRCPDCGSAQVTRALSTFAVAGAGAHATRAAGGGCAGATGFR